ncbi:hypothetical protein [Providencia stuartii]|uniref:hypothetical protein n=1 Tax=Providencia stuartii TaxID=588 RepID=UPI002AA0B01D|nr:hypothetical protein [Providencia stuartii]
MDKSRQQFEYWYFNNHSHEQKYPLHKDDSGEYYYDGTRKAWVVWQASRESLEIKLPDLGDVILDDYFVDGFNDAISDIEKILISNGVKIKNE